MSKISARASLFIERVNSGADAAQCARELAEIVADDPVTAVGLALEILNSKIGGAEIGAVAFSMLYQTDKVAAFKYIQEKGAFSEAPIFDTMLEEVWKEVPMEPRSPEFRGVVHYLRSAILFREMSGIAKLQDA